MSKKRIIVPLAPGFEEIEAVTIVDVLRRAGLEVVLAALDPGPVRGAHGLTMLPGLASSAVEATTGDQRRGLFLAVKAALHRHRGLLSGSQASAAASHLLGFVGAAPVGLHCSRRSGSPSSVSSAPWSAR